MGKLLGSKSRVACRRGGHAVSCGFGFAGEYDIERKWRGTCCPFTTHRSPPISSSPENAEHVLWMPRSWGRVAVGPHPMTYHDMITIEFGKRAGRPILRGMRITVADVLGWLAVGMTHAKMIADYPELHPKLIYALASPMRLIENGELSRPRMNEASPWIRTSASNFVVH